MRCLTWNSVTGGPELEGNLIIVFVLLVGGLCRAHVVRTAHRLLLFVDDPRRGCLLLGYEAGLMLLGHNIRSSISNFVFLPLLMFILLGDVMLCNQVLRSRCWMS